MKLKCTDKNACYINQPYTVCLVLESCAEKKEKKGPWPQATVVFYLAALSVVSQPFWNLLSSCSSLHFKGSEDISIFLLTCTVTKYLGELAILGNPEYLLRADFRSNLVVETPLERGNKKEQVLRSQKQE